MNQLTDHENRRTFWLLFVLQLPATALLFLPFCAIGGTPFDIIQREGVLAFTSPYGLAVPGLIAPFLAVMKLAALGSRGLPRSWAWASVLVVVWAVAATASCIPWIIDEGSCWEVVVAAALVVGGLAALVVGRRRGLRGAPLFTALLIVGYVPNAVLALLFLASDLEVGGHVAIFASALYMVEFGLITKNYT